MTILACSGRVLRFLEHSRVRQTVELESVPTVLHVPRGSLGDKAICGFSDGRVIQFKIEHFSTNGKEVGMKIGIFRKIMNKFPISSRTRHPCGHWDQYKWYNMSGHFRLCGRRKNGANFGTQRWNCPGVYDEVRNWLRGDWTTAVVYQRVLMRNFFSLLLKI